MTVALFVTLDRLEADAFDAFVASARASVARALSPSDAATLRFVLRATPIGATVEPFLGAASLQALSTVKRKRRWAFAALRAIVEAARPFASDVGVACVDEGAAWPAERVDVEASMLETTRWRPPVWLRIAWKSR